MFKPTAIVIFLLLFFVSQAQQVSLPADLRQHTLTQYNASLFNPAFSLDRNNPQSVSFWTRWQWQNIDADPTTLFLNYSRSLNENSAAGIGFFQHNTGIYFNTGGAINYAYQIEFNRLIKLSVGANIFGFQQQLADTRFPVNPIPGIPQSLASDDFILQVAPGFNLQIENFSLSLASENLFDYNFTDKAANTAASDKIFMGMASYDFPIMASDSTAYIQPSIYLRTIPELENQIGLNVLFSTQKFWVQSGFNNFYGISVGAGGTFFNRFSVGALVEFGTSGSLNSKDPSFEILASYFLGKPEERRPLVASGILEDDEEVVLMAEEELTNEKMKEELEKAEQFANQKEEEKEEVKVVYTPEEVDAEDIEEEESKETRKAARKLAAEQKALEKQQRKDSIAEVKKEKAALDLVKKQEENQPKRDAEEAEKLEAEKVEEAEELEKIERLREENAEKAAAEEAKKAEERLEAERLETKEREDALRKAKETEAIAEAQRIAQQRKLDSISDAKKAEAVARQLKLKEQQQDSINAAKKAEAMAEAINEQERFDSITKVSEEKEVAAKKAADAAAVISEAETKQVEPEVEVVKPQAGEKYEEVANEDGLEPGYYLIANVFGTKKYFDAFMADLRRKGLQPKSFFRSINRYNYAYLERYDTISDARRARDNKFSGKYGGKTWIFRVVGK